MDLEKIDSVILTELTKSTAIGTDTLVVRKHIDEVLVTLERMIRSTRTKHKDCATQHAIEHVVEFLEKQGCSQYDVIRIISAIGLTGDRFVDKHKLLNAAQQISTEYKPWWKIRPRDLKGEVRRIIEESHSG